MFEHRLGQTLIVKPEVDFIKIREVMKSLGWEEQKLSSSGKPLVPNESEHARWSWQGGKPFIVYTFNPVTRLRVLDVATLPPRKRGEIATQLLLVQDEDIQNYLDSDEPREKLLGLWVINETQRLDLVESVVGLSRDNDPLVAKEAKRIAEKLKQVAEKRTQTLASLRLIASASEKVIREIHTHPELVDVLMPSLKDCYSLFDDHLAIPVYEAMKKVYANLGNLAVGGLYTHLQVMACHAGILRWPNELSEKFPRAYRDLTGWMKPDKVWLTWAWVQPLENEKLEKGEFSLSSKKISYDGLAWVDDHWVWLPKMHRVVMPLVASGFSAKTSVH